MKLFAILSLVAAACYAEARFSGKVVLVTGGSAGIGFATSMSFAREGAHVIFCARDSNPSWYNGSFAALQINGDLDVIRNKGSARFVKADVSNRADVKALFENIRNNEGTLDIAVNNAGITGGFGPVESIFDYYGTKYDPMMTNFYGIAHCTSLEVALWKEQNKDGIIVNLASVNGYKASPGAPLYSTSKHAIIGFTKSVALENANTKPYIRCNAIAPGFTDTPLVWNQCKFLEDGKTQPWEGDFINHDHPLWKKYESMLVNPDGKIISPYDQANMILFLASDAAKSINGVVMSVDAGSTAQ